MSVATSDMKASGDKRQGIPIRNAILIAGPTASGKSKLALDLAEKHSGVIVNTDSMQVYSVLNVLTARPDRQDLARAPHHLYGHVSPATAYSTGTWARDVSDLAASGAFEGKRPIFVGGTGLYFRALTEGISEMPEIPPEIRERWRYRLAEEGPAKLHRILMHEDGECALVLRASDGQRIVRALEVLEASGRSILAWQAEQGEPLIDAASARLFVIDAERELLVERIERRFDTMLENGALEEVRALAAMNLSDDLPAIKAIGFRELNAADSGHLTFEEAIYRAKVATRQYAKRQATWFRNQLSPLWQRLSMEKNDTLGDLKL
jgi:tRNA dimethylallyltransferase